MTAKIEIRSERISDYADIGAIHARAFSSEPGVSSIVALQRQRREFDAELSLVAEKAGKVVGHILFSPYRVRLLGQTVRGVNLSPLGIEPAYQREGIGGQLIQEGHALALRKGYTLSLVLGHPTYYPRFGYHTRAFGSTELVCKAQPASEDMLNTRQPVEEDIPALLEIWRQEEQGVDLALEPGADLLDWFSTNPAIQATVYLSAETPVGYTRIHRDYPQQPRVFLARDVATARAMLATLAAQQQTGDEPLTCTLPLHPFSASASALGQARARAWDAGMVRELVPGQLAEYLVALDAGRPAGRPIWPVAFDLT